MKTQSTRFRPGPDIRNRCHFAVIGRTEFQIPVTQFAKAEYGLGRLLCSVKRRSPLAAYGYAKREGVDNSHVSRVVNLTTLAQDIVEAILEDALPDQLTLFDIAVDPPVL